jgi:hypothetical protein
MIESYIQEMNEVADLNEEIEQSCNSDGESGS